LELSGIDIDKMELTQYLVHIFEFMYALPILCFVLWMLQM